jgi:ketol-acid reductoisomerase
LQASVFGLQENFMRLYSQKDVDKKALRGARIAILGYGSQGRAHALNLHDSGYAVVVGVRKGASWNKAKKDGLKVMEPAAAVKGAQLVAMLVPDLTQKSLYTELNRIFEKGATLLFAHGFNIHFKQIKPRKDLDVVLIAPKGPGDLVRRQFQQGRGVPMPRPSRLPTPTASAARAAVSWRPPLPRRPRRICSASKRCCAAAPRNSWSKATKPWWRRVTSRRSPIMNACTNSS